MNSLFIELRRYGGIWRWRIIKKPKVGNKRVMAAGENRDFDVAAKEALDAYDVVKGSASVRQFSGGVDDGIMASSSDYEDDRDARRKTKS